VERPWDVYPATSTAFLSLSLILGVEYPRCHVEQIAAAGHQ
jgi:hypothetical protein